jgi:hypothetical protein
MHEGSGDLSNSAWDFSIKGERGDVLRRFFFIAAAASSEPKSAKLSAVMSGLTPVLLAGGTP